MTSLTLNKGEWRNIDASSGIRLLMARERYQLSNVLCLRVLGRNNRNCIVDAAMPCRARVEVPGLALQNIYYVTSFTPLFAVLVPRRGSFHPRRGQDYGAAHRQPQHERRVVAESCHAAPLKSRGLVISRHLLRPMRGDGVIPVEYHPTKPHRLSFQNPASRSSITCVTLPNPHGRDALKFSDYSIWGDLR